MRTETELQTRAELRRRREERRKDRLINICSAAGLMACVAYLVYLEWPALVVALG